MICPMCNKEPEAIIINTTSFALVEYTTQKRRSEELGICVWCVMALEELD